MSITIVDVATNQNSNSQTAATPAEPTGATTDDLMLMIDTMDDPGTTAIWTETDTAFVQIDNINDATGNDKTVYLGRKKHTGTPGSYTNTHDQVAGPTAGALACFRGVDTTTPMDVTYVRATHSNSALNTPTTAAPAITTVTDGAMVVLCQYLSNTISGAPGPPTGYTELAAFCGNAAFSNDGLYMCYKIVANAGVETPGAFTHTDVTGTSDTTCITIALRPAAGAGIGRLGGIDNRFNSFIR